MIKFKMYFLLVILFTQFPMIFSYLYTDPDGIINIDIDLTEAVYLHAICVACFVFFYGLNYCTRKPKKTDQLYQLYNLKFGYFIATFGVFIVVLQVLQSGSLVEHFTNLFYGDSHNSREAYLLDSRSGGLPGYLKMFANAPLAIYLFSFSMFLNISLSKDDLVKIRKLLIFSFLCVVIKAFFSLDRLSLLAIILTLFFYIGRRGVSFTAILFSVVLLVLGNFISSARLSGYTIFDFLLLYMKLGLVNLQLVINGGYDYTDYTYGFQTFFHFITYFDRTIFDSLGMSFQDYDWYWNPALYFVSYGFLDFGYFIPAIYSGLGVILASLDKSIANGKVCFPQATYFVFLYAFASFFTVPAIRGVEFVLALLICYFMCKFTVRKVRGENAYY